MESDASNAGGPSAAAPVRLPDIDEFNQRRKKGHGGGSGSRASSRPDSPLASGSGLLAPAHALLSAHPATVGGAVGLPGKHGGHGRATRVAADNDLWPMDSATAPAAPLSAR